MSHVLFLILGLTCTVPGSTHEGDRITAEPNLVTFSRIDRAWTYSRGKNTKVAVLDWLFDMSEEASAKYVNPTSLVPGEPIGSAEAWHGEWMATIVHQVAPEAKIIPIRARPAVRSMAPGEDGRQAYEKYLVQGIRLAADQGAVAVTNSMGPVKHCEELRAAIDYAEQRGTIFIDVHPEYLVYTETTYQPVDPNECDRRILHAGIVSVPEHTARPNPSRDLYVWPYQIDPVFRDGWGYSNGPPIIGGTIALVKSENPELTPQEIRAILVETARMENGFRVLDAEAAVVEAIRRKEHHDTVGS